MKKYFVSMAVLASCVVLGFAQQDSAPAGGAVTNTLTGTAATGSQDGQALKDLNEKEKAEIRVLEENSKSARQKQQEEVKALQDQLKNLSDKSRAEMEAFGTQIKSIRDKYRSERYALMDRLNPGSGARLAQRDREMAELEAQQRKDLDALNTGEKAEMAKGKPTKELMAKFQADRKAIYDSYAAKRKALRSQWQINPAK
ncbi:MAG: hypothetical protein Q7R35_01420 [Elusimicrobiota bacterium]|nr:hypothetical protein [Elusimicrobiota bacterium]